MMARQTMVYTQVQHVGAVIYTPDGRGWVVDSVDVTEGNEGYDTEAVAYLSPVKLEENQEK